VRHFKLDDGKLYRIDENLRRLHLPRNQREAVIKRFHEGLAHLGFNSIHDLVHRRYWWPKIDKAIKTYIVNCPQCQLNRSHHSSSQPPVPIRPFPPTALPFEGWDIDFIQHLPVTERGNRHIITAIDYATRCVVAKAVPDMTAAIVVKFLYEDILMNYGSPDEIISDRGSSFLSVAVAGFERLQNIRHFASSQWNSRTHAFYVGSLAHNTYRFVSR
jgi:hypothetical protein